ncbi:MAG: hypothetical protein WA970_14185, partial [Gammaproteobacteria bacterium]
CARDISKVALKTFFQTEIYWPPSGSRSGRAFALRSGWKTINGGGVATRTVAKNRSVQAST